MPSAIRAITRIQDADDANLTLTNGYMVVYDSGQGKFVTQAVPTTSPGGSAGYVQYNNGGFAGHDGFVYDGAGKVTLSVGLVASKIHPAANSINAFGLYRANGTTQDFCYDSTNGRFGIGLSSPAYPLDVATSIQAGVAIIAKGGTWIALFGAQVQCGATDIGSAGGVGYSGGNTVLAAGGGVALTFRIGGTEHMRLTNGGMFAVGQTSATAMLDIAASTTTRASLRIRSGVAPTSPNDGDIWFDGTDYKCRIGGVTKTFTVT